MSKKPFVTPASTCKLSEEIGPAVCLRVAICCDKIAQNSPR